MRRITTNHRVPVMLLAGLAIAFTACKGKPEDPHLTFINVGFSLKLPQGMQHALDSLVPGFRPVIVGKFRSDIAQYAAEAGGGMQPLFATVTDLDGDGTLDAVLEGNSPGDTAMRVVAIMNGAKPTAMDVARIPQYDADAVGLYLSRPTGSRAGTFELVDYPDSSTLYKYSAGRFVGTKVGN
ncbi:MAG: hypothetical protein ACYC3L_15095 [Gemmatimonadaceae bacterium]